MSSPRGPTDWPVWLAALAVVVLLILAYLLLTGRAQP